MSKEARFNSANEPFSQNGSRRLYSKKDAPQDFVASRRRKDIATSASRVQKKKRGRPAQSKKPTIARSKKKISTEKSRSQSDVALAIPSLPAKNIKNATISKSCSECNDCRKDCCDNYSMRRIENVVFFVCILFAVVATLFVQDHTFLQALKKPSTQLEKIIPETPSKLAEPPIIPTPVIEDVPSTLAPTSPQTKIEDKVESIQKQISDLAQQLNICQNMPDLTITLIVPKPVCEVKEESQILVTMCQPGCCDTSESFAGSGDTLQISNSLIVEGDLYIFGCGGGIGGGNTINGMNIHNKPVYTSPINWGVPPLASSRDYSSSISSSQSYNYTWSQACVPPAPHNLGVFAIAAVINSFFRTRNTI